MFPRLNLVYSIGEAVFEEIFKFKVAAQHLSSLQSACRDLYVSSLPCAQRHTKYHRQDGGWNGMML